MTVTVRRVEFFYVMVHDQPGEAYKLLASLAETGVNLLAFNAVPMGVEQCQLVLFPEDSAQLRNAASRCNMQLQGPRMAFLVQGDDDLGALVGLHRKLRDVGINLQASSGVSNSGGSFGYVFYVRPDEYETAAATLEV